MCAFIGLMYFFQVLIDFLKFYSGYLTSCANRSYTGQGMETEVQILDPLRVSRYIEDNTPHVRPLE